MVKLEILYGILFLICFLIGIIFGLLVPSIVKNYFNVFTDYEKQIELLKKEIDEKSNLSNRDSIDNSKILNEWLNGGDDSEE